MGTPVLFSTYNTVCEAMVAACFTLFHGVVRSLLGTQGLFAGGGGGERAITYAGRNTEFVTYTDGQWFTIWQPGDSGTFVFSATFDSNGEGGAIWNYKAGGIVSVGQTAMNNGNTTDDLDFNWSAHATNGRTVEFRFLMPCCQNAGVVQMRVIGESVSTPTPLFTNWVRMFWGFAPAVCCARACE